MTTRDADARTILARRLRTQADECAKLGSQLWADLMERAAGDVEAGGPFLAVLQGHESDPGPMALALRVFGGIHRLALAGTAPDLAAHLPSTGGSGDHDRAWRAALTVVADHVDELRAGLDQAPQTNEVGRSAALAPAFWIAAQRGGGRPLRMLEVGASAGLNLRWDHFRHEVTDPPAGDPASTVIFPASWYEGALPPEVQARAEVIERAGCDVAPIDVTNSEGRLRLLSYVWP